MNIIDWFVKIVWLLFGIVIFQGIFMLILKLYPQICVPSQDMTYCLETFGWGSIISISLGATWGLILPKYLFRREADNLPSSVFSKNDVVIFIATLITGLLIIAVDIVIVGIFYNSRISYDGFWWPSDPSGFLVALMIIVIDLVVIYFFHKKILY